MKVYLIVPSQSAIRQQIDNVSNDLVGKIGPDMLAYIRDVFTKIGESPVGMSLLGCAAANPDKFLELESNIIELVKAGYKDGITKSAVLQDITDYVEAERQKAVAEQQMAYLNNLPDDMTQH